MTFGNTGGFTNVKLDAIRVTTSPQTIYGVPANTIAQFNLFALKPDAANQITIEIWHYDASTATNLSSNPITIINRTATSFSGFSLVQRSVTAWNYNLAGLFDSGRLTDFSFDTSGNLRSNGIITLYPQEQIAVRNIVNGVWVYFGLTEFTVS